MGYGRGLRTALYNVPAVLEETKLETKVPEREIRVTSTDKTNR
jgi:hypothetical protein